MTDEYGFAVEAVGQSQHFKMVNNNGIFAQLKKMNINTTPTLILVHKSRPIIFELVRGFVSYAELAEKFSLAKQYLKTKGLI